MSAGGRGSGESDIARNQPVSSVQDALVEVARASAGRGSAAEVAQIVAEAVRSLLPADRSSIWRWVPERDAIELLAAAQDQDVTVPPTGLALPLTASGYRPVLEEGRALREADLHHHQTQAERTLVADGLCARLSVPVLIDGRPVGLVTAISRTPGCYNVAHERLLKQIAVQLAVGLEQARLLTETCRHQDRLLGLERVAQRLSGNVAREGLLDMVLDEAIRAVGGDSGTLLMWNEQRQALVPILSTIKSAISRVLRPGEGVAGQALQRMAVTMDRESQPGEDGIQASIAAPLVADGRLLGVVTANIHDSARRFDEEDVQVFEVYAGQAAGVILTARSFETERRQRRGAEEAARAAAAIVSETDEQKRLDLIVERAVTIVGGVSGALNLIDPVSGNLVARAAYGWVREHCGKVIPRGGGLGYRVLDERRPIIVDDFSTFPAPISFIDPTPYGPGMGVPVLAHGEILGVLVVHGATGDPLYTSEDSALLQMMADLAAVAVDNIRILKQEQQRRQQLEAIRAVTAEITRELDLRTLLELLMKRASELVNSPAVSVLLWDEQTGLLAPNAWCGFGEWTADLRFRLGEGVAGVAAQRREGIIVDDYRNWPGASKEICAQTDTRAVMGVPIIYQERLIGALTASRFGPSEPFTRQDLALLDLFGSQAAIAIENARLFEQATAAEALRELAQLKAEFLNTASHELRTPLSLIHGYAELLIHRADTLSPAEVAQMSGEIYTGSQTLIRLVDDLLDFSRLDRGRLALRLQTVSLGALLDHIVLDFLARPGGGRIRTTCPPDLEVAVDPERLHQVVGNLLSNALAYAHEGPIDVRALAEGDVVRIEVADVGPGLQASEIDRVWETFYRGVEAAHLPNRGSGLGLAVVKQLVELHGGTVGVQSVPGQGATFWLTLPTRIAMTDAAAPVVLHPEDRLDPLPAPALSDPNVLSA